MKKKNFLGNLRLVYVDGFKIRNFIDSDFGLMHQHSDVISNFAPKFYIPPKEIWLDYHYKDELEFLWEEVCALPSRSIKSISQWKKWIKRELCQPGPAPDFRVRKEKDDNLTIIYVDGKKVRQYLDPEFILGGHEFVYSYIPKREVWLDFKVDPAEIPYLLVHEKVERELMKQGTNYDIAHDYATVADKEKRRSDGLGFYPGDEKYPWRGWDNEEIIKNLIVE